MKKKIQYDINFKIEIISSWVKHWEYDTIILSLWIDAYDHFNDLIIKGQHYENETGQRNAYPI